MNIISLFTDGSCLNNQKAGGKKAFAGFGGYIVYNRETSESSSYHDEIDLNTATNNVGELMSFKVGLQLIIEHEKNKKQKSFIYVYPDSQYVINTYSRDIKKWITNGWKRSGNQSIKNLELIQSTHELIQNSQYKIFYKHYHAHTAQPKDKTSEDYFLWKGNDNADRLAKMGAEKAKTRHEIFVKEKEKEKLKKKISFDNDTLADVVVTNKSKKDKTKKIIIDEESEEEIIITKKLKKDKKKKVSKNED